MLKIIKYLLVLSYIFTISCNADKVNNNNLFNISPGKIIVQYKVDKKDISIKSISKYINNYKINEIERLIPDRTLQRIKSRYIESGLQSKSNIENDYNKFNKLVLLKFDGMSIEETLDVINKLKSDPEIEYVVPDHIVHTTNVIPDDPYYYIEWGMNKIQAPAAWDYTTGSNNIIVAVIDTGVDCNHPDLANKCVPGYDYINNDNDPMDDNRHGTHVAGIIAAQGNNSIGIAGVAWNIKIMPLKFLGSSGTGSTSNAIKCIDYSIAYGAHILNNSWGGGSGDIALKSAIERAKNANILFVAAAGNGGSDHIGDDNDIYPYYPSSYDSDNIISVASTTTEDSKSIFSNYGKISVDIAAPGDSIYSTIPGGGYLSLSGTSMATPFVAGTAALLKSRNFTLNYSDIKNILMNNVDQIDILSDKIVSGGRLNAYKVVLNYFLTYRSPCLIPPEKNGGTQISCCEASCQ